MGSKLCYFLFAFLIYQTHPKVIYAFKRGDFGANFLLIVDSITKGDKNKPSKVDSTKSVVIYLKKSEGIL